MRKKYKYDWGSGEKKRYTFSGVDGEAVPVLSAIKEKYPGCHIGYICNIKDKRHNRDKSRGR